MNLKSVFRCCNLIYIYILLPSSYYDVTDHQLNFYYTVVAIRIYYMRELVNYYKRFARN